MFDRANQRVAGLVAGMENELADRLERLDNTATSWYDGTPKSAQQRSRELRAASGLCRRVGALYGDEEDQAGLLGLADELDDQSSRLADLHHELQGYEYEDQNGLAPQFSSQGELPDESHLAAVNRTDWDLFMSVEPREFVAANDNSLEDADEMRDRAFGYIESCTGGHGLTHTSRKKIAAAFLARVEQIRSESVEDQ